ncbi:MAG TPA: DUF4340 domain-containing protein, partial [Leptospiraceae bacterium]|nr:DUF4340 domain-containing protein [Leptospiraceae bacterium]
MKKILMVAIAFIVLAFVFFYSEERHEEGLTEIAYWKIEPDEIRYYPPKDHSEFSNFIKSELTFKRIKTGLKSSPYFTVEGIDPESKKPFLYEAGYNVKNLFTEMSVLNVKSINPANPDLLKKFQISEQSSPALEIYLSSKPQKKIYLGEQSNDKNYRYILSDKEVLTTIGHVFQKFSQSPFDLRDRQYLHFGEFELARMIFQSEGVRITIENLPETKNGTQMSRWFKTTSGKNKMDPSQGSQLFSLLQAFKADLYPDEIEGEGFLVAKELTATETFANLQLILTNGMHYKIKLFPKVILKN